jgi:hypothetical protein
VREALLLVQAVDPELVLSFSCVHDAVSSYGFRRRFPSGVRREKETAAIPW